MKKILSLFVLGVFVFVGFSSQASAAPGKSGSVILPGRGGEIMESVRGPGDAHFGSITVRGMALEIRSLMLEIGRNPQIGKEIQIKAKNVVKFKAGADLAGKVN